MDRFRSRYSAVDRSRGPAPGAPADGLAQGTPYTAVVQSALVGGLVTVTVPALHLSQTFQAHAPTGAPPIGSTVSVLFDESKIPWIVAAPSIAIGPPLVSALPAGPVDGQEVRYQNAAMATTGVEWRLVYRAASASAYKWEFVGGSCLSAYKEGKIEQTLASATFVYQEAENAPAIVVPLSGDYEVGLHVAVVQNYAAAGLPIQLNIAVGTSFGSPGFIGAFYPNYQFDLIPMYGKFASAGLTTGGVMKVGIAGNNKTSQAWGVQYLTLTMLPVRVG